MESNQSSPVKTSEGSTSQKQEAFTHLAQGKRHLLVKDYQEAVDSLSQACTLLDEQYGVCANECGDAYFNYGKALLELARSESGVLGDAIDGERDGSNDEDEEEEDDDEEEVCEQGDENDEEKVENDKNEEDDTQEGVTENKEDQKDGNKEEEETSDNEEASYLKIAWEVLEVAKLIFERQAEGNPTLSLMLAEVYLKLGEVSLENENYDRAIEDIESCLRIQTAHLPEDDRFIAETYYQLGMAYSLNAKFDDAIKNFKNAMDVIIKRIKNLEAKKESGTECVEETKSDPFYSVDREIQELKELLPEMQDKMNDMEDFKKETLRAVCNVVGQPSTGHSDGSSGSSSSTANITSAAPVETKPASNISHLVRKKRKPDEAVGDLKGTEAVKQAKTE